MPVMALDAATPSTVPARPRPSVVLTKVRPATPGSSLRCYVDVMIPSDYVTIHWVAVHQIGPHCSIRLPEASAERRPMFFDMPPRYLDELGARGFERAVIAAVRAAYPDILTGEVDT